MNGNILDKTAIVLKTGATLNGRALAQTAVTLDSNSVNAPGSAVSTPTPVPPPVLIQTPPPKPSVKFKIGDKIKSTTTVTVMKSAAGSIIGYQVSGKLGKVVGGPMRASNLNWWKMNYDTGSDGWTAEDYLIKYVAPTKTPAKKY